MSERIDFRLPESAIPTHWVNLLADLPGEPLPPLHPGTKEPLGPDDLAPLFPMALIEQEVSAEPEIEIPEEVRDVYKLWRPTPLLRARRLERALDTPAHIYYKYEGVSPAGSHKPNTAVAQAFYNKQAGIAKLATETGAGQWGSALALACQLFGLECEVWMVGVSYDQKPYRRAMIETWGGTVHRSPSDLTEAGRSQAEHSSGSLGIAISEAVEVAAQNEDTNYSLGSVLNHVCLHQTVIGQEAIAQLELAGEYPDVVVGCVGGGSNFAGVAYPFMRAKLRDGPADAVRRRRAGRLPDADPGRLPLRLRRHGRAHAADADVHAGPRLRPAARARRRAALPRRRAEPLARSSRRGSSSPSRSRRLRPSNTLLGAWANRSVLLTLGGGGHAAAVLEASAPDGRLLGIDADPAALAAAGARLAAFGERATLAHGNFRDLGRLAREQGFEQIDGLLLDLGVSSHQIDTPERGFSFAADAPLDMRLDPTSGATAADLVNDTPESELADLIFRYGEERGSRRIARFIAEARRKRPIETTARAGRAGDAGAGRAGTARSTRPRAPSRRCGSPSTASWRAWRRRCRRRSSCWRRADGWRLSRFIRWKIGSSSCSFAPSSGYGGSEQPARLQIITKKPIEANEQEARANPAQPKREATHCGAILRMSELRISMRIQNNNHFSILNSPFSTFMKRGNYGCQHPTTLSTPAGESSPQPARALPEPRRRALPDRGGGDPLADEPDLARPDRAAGDAGL